MDRGLKDKDSSLVKVRDATLEKERQLMEAIQKLSSQLEEARVKIRQLEWFVKDLEKEKSNAIERYTTRIVYFILKCFITCLVQ